MKKLYTFLSIFSFTVLFMGLAMAAPYVIYPPSVVPDFDARRYLGTTTPAKLYWVDIFTNQITITDGTATNTISSASALATFSYPFSGISSVLNATTSGLRMASSSILGELNIGTLTATSGTSYLNALSLGTALADANIASANKWNSYSFPFIPTDHFGLTMSATSTNLFTSGSAGFYASGTSIFSTTTIQGTANAGNFIATSTTASSSFSGLVARQSLEVTDNIVGSKLLNITGATTLAGGVTITCSGCVTSVNLAASTISGIALGSSLNALTATNGTLTFSGSYDGSTARTVGLNLGSANTWTSSSTFPVLNIGDITATNTLKISNNNIPAYHSLSFTSGSASSSWTSTTSYQILMPQSSTFIDFRCFASGATRSNVRINNSAGLALINISATSTIGTSTPSNASVGADYINVLFSSVSSATSTTCTGRYRIP